MSPCHSATVIYRTMLSTETCSKTLSAARRTSDESQYATKRQLAVFSHSGTLLRSSTSWWSSTRPWQARKRLLQKTTKSRKNSLTNCFMFVTSICIDAFLSCCRSDSEISILSDNVTSVSPTSIGFHCFLSPSDSSRGRLLS
jgi:hypothetical protein